MKLLQSKNRYLVSLLLWISAPFAAEMKHEPLTNSSKSNGGQAMFTPDQIRKILMSDEWDLELIEVLDFKEENAGTRSHKTGYSVHVLKSAQNRPTKHEMIYHWGPAYLTKGWYLVLAQDFWNKERWLEARDLFLKVTKNEGPAVFDANKQAMDEILGSSKILSDSILQNVLAGKMNLILGGPNKVERPNSSEIEFNRLDVIKSLVGKVGSTIPVELKAPSVLRLNGKYIIAVNTEPPMPHEVSAIEYYPGNRDRLVKLHQDRLKELSEIKK